MLRARPPKGVHQLWDRLKTVLQPLLEAAENDAHQLGRYVCAEGRWARRGLLKDAEHELGEIRSEKRLRPREEFEQHRADGPDVAPRMKRSTASTFLTALGSKNLIAKSSPSSMCRAATTTPMPPRPSSRSTRYLSRRSSPSTIGTSVMTTLPFERTGSAGPACRSAVRDGKGPMSHAPVPDAPILVNSSRDRSRAVRRMGNWGSATRSEAAPGGAMGSGICLRAPRKEARWDYEMPHRERVGTRESRAIRNRTRYVCSPTVGDSAAAFGLSREQLHIRQAGGGAVQRGQPGL